MFHSSVDNSCSQFKTFLHSFITVLGLKWFLIFIWASLIFLLRTVDNVSFVCECVTVTATKSLKRFSRMAKHSWVFEWENLLEPFNYIAFREWYLFKVFCILKLVWLHQKKFGKKITILIFYIPTLVKRQLIKEL